MLAWINGPFGVGKTATAFELHRRLPSSAVCDPSMSASGMRGMLPMITPPDHQGQPGDPAGHRLTAASMAQATMTRTIQLG